MSTGKVLLVYMEPTPYILGLLERLAARWQGKLAVWFVGTNLSQPWGAQACPVDMTVLPAGAPAQWRLLRQALAEREFALIHLGGWAGAPVFKLAMLLGRLHGVPVTVESDTPAPPRQSSWNRVLKRLCYPVLFRLPTHFFPGGKRQADYLRGYGVGSARITEAHMTVDVARLAAWRAAVDAPRRARLRESFGCKDGRCLFLYVGRLEPHKGVLDLLQAFRMLQSQGSLARLLIVGAGSQQGELAAALMADKDIDCIGRLEGERLLEAFAAADVLVLPSRFEPWGLVVNEAMAAGLPVIVSNRVGCVDDLVVAGGTGLVVPAEDCAALSQALHRLAANADLRAEMGRRASALIAGWTLEHEADIIVAGWKVLAGSP